MKAESGFIENVSSRLGLPGDVAAGLPAVFITGCREIRVERHEGLLAFSEELIDLNCGQVIVRIKGEKLEIAGMCRGEIRVRGKLDAVAFVYTPGG